MSLKTTFAPLVAVAALAVAAPAEASFHTTRDPESLGYKVAEAVHHHPVAAGLGLVVAAGGIGFAATRKKTPGMDV